MNTRTVYSVNIYNTIQYIYYTNTEKYDSLLYYVLNNKSNYFKQWKSWQTWASENLKKTAWKNILW